MSKCNIDTSWIKHIIMDDKGNFKDRVDGCLITILIHGVHNLETMEPCCTHCSSFKDIYDMNQWCSDYVFLNMSLR